MGHANKQHHHLRCLQQTVVEGTPRVARRTVTFCDSHVLTSTARGDDDTGLAILARRRARVGCTSSHRAILGTPHLWATRTEASSLALTLSLVRPHGGRVRPGPHRGPWFSLSQLLSPPAMRAHVRAPPADRCCAGPRGAFAHASCLLLRTATVLKEPAFLRRWIHGHEIHERPARSWMALKFKER